MADEATLLEALREVDDPEIGMNIVDLGLVYGVEIDGGRVIVRMTMTSPACPLGESMAEDVRRAIRRAEPDVEDVDVQVVWEPPWTPERMTDTARAALGWSK